MNRRRLLWLLLGVVWLLFATPVNAQDPIEVDIQPFFDGHMKLGALHPVRIVLHNQGGTRDVVVSARFVGRDALVEREVNLPTGAQKAVTLFMPTSSGLLNKATLRVTVRDMTSDEVLVRQDVTVTLHTSDVLFVGRVRGAGRGLDFLTSREMQIADIPLDALPEHPAALHMLDMLVISGVETSRLSPAAQRSLVAWVNRGGTLVLGGGADAAAVLSGLPEVVQPVRLGEVTTITADDLEVLADTTGEPIRVSGTFAFANATPTTGFVRLALDDGRPLLVQQRLGFGTIYWLAMDPNQPPFDAWAGREAFWNVLLPPDVVAFAQPVFKPNAWAVQSGTVALLSQSRPSLGLLSIVLLIYILFVGPINYLVLRFKQRLEWAWITIPLFTLVFSGITYMWGTRLRGTELWLIEAAVGFMLPNGTMESEGGVLFFSPIEKKFTIEAPGDTLVSTLTTQSNFGFQDVSSAKRFRFGDRAQVGPVSMRPGAQVVFYAAPPVQTAPVRIETSLTTETTTIRITNTGEHPLKNLVLFHESTQTRHPELLPGETWTVQWNANVLFPRLIMNFLWPNEYFGETNEADETYRWARQQFVSGLLSTRFSSDVPPPVFEGFMDPLVDSLRAPIGGDVFFGAWLDAPLYNLSIPGASSVETKAMHLLMARIQLSTPEGEFIPPGDIPVWPEAPLLSQSRCHGWWGVGTANETATFSAWLPAPHPTDTLLLMKMGAAMNNTPKRWLDVWNVRTGEWEQVSYTSNAPVRLPVADYTDETGRVRIRVPQDDVCVYPAIGLERTTGAGS